jgi:MFS family permease
MIALRLQGRLSLWHLALAIALAGTVLLGVAAVVLPSPLGALPAAFSLLLAPTANAALIAAMLRATPEGMRGRVNSTVTVAATGLAALAPLTSGLLVEHVSGHWAMAAFAAAIGVAAILCLALPGLGNAERSAATTAPAP